jgi:single-strand DNA-binding protein
VAFGKTGETIERFLRKGSMVCVSGSLHNSSWDDKETGQKRFKTEITVDEFSFAESKASAEARGVAPGPSAQPPAGTYNNPPAQQAGGGKDGFY